MRRLASLGLDLGTSSLKALLLDVHDGSVLAEHAVDYPHASPAPGWSEQDPEDWWRACVVATRAVLAAARREHAVDVVGIGLAGQMHTFVLTDRAGRPLRPAITWLDTRAQGLQREVAALVASSGLDDEVVNPVVAGLTLLPLAWLARFERATLDRADALLLAKDALRARLTGRLASEPTDASATGFGDVAGRSWSTATLACLGIATDLVPPLGECGDVAGHLRADAADELGLPGGLPVAFGAGDQQAAALALGTLRPGDAQLMVGSGAQAFRVLGEVTRGGADRLHTFCHVDGFARQASVANAGTALAWVRTTLGLDWATLYRAPTDVAHAPVFVPSLTGERLFGAERARGGWVGLTHGHDASALAGAAVAGVVTSIAAAVDAVLEGAARPAVLRASGGGLRHAAFAAAVSDAVQLPLEVVDEGSASAVGAALLGAAAASGGGVGAAALAERRHATGSVPTRTYLPDAGAEARWRAHARWRAELDALGLHELVARRPGAVD